MNRKNQLLKHVLWVIIVSAFSILLFTSYKQIKRIEASKRLDEINLLSKDSNEYTNLIINDDANVYSIESN